MGNIRDHGCFPGGHERVAILAIYSHMISYPMYLPNYAVGSLIQFQVEQYLKGKDFPREIERIFSIGRVIPQEWMKQAVGTGISPEAMLIAAEESLEVIRLKK